MKVFIFIFILVSNLYCFGTNFITYDTNGITHQSANVPIDSSGADKTTVGVDNSAPAPTSTAWTQNGVTNGTPQSDLIEYGAQGGKNNVINGLDGNDYIKVLNPESYDKGSKIYGDDGNDWIESCRGENTSLYGGNGDDTLVSYLGTSWIENTSLNGGAGNDMFYPPRTGQDTGSNIHGDAGFDTLVLADPSHYLIYYNGGGEYEIRYLSTGTPDTWNYDVIFYIYTIEKIIFTPTGTPDINGVPEPAITTWYLDPANPTQAQSAPTPGMISDMSIKSIYTHSLTLNNNGNINNPTTLFFRNLPIEATGIYDDNFNLLSNITIVNTTDNSGNTIGQEGRASFTFTGATQNINISTDIPNLENIYDFSNLNITVKFN